MDIIFLENPESVSKETTIFNEEQKFFRVYDFSSKKNTKITYKGKGISKEEAINLIKYEGIECRLFDNNVKKKQKCPCGSGKRYKRCCMPKGIKSQ